MRIAPAALASARCICYIIPEISAREHRVGIEIERTMQPASSFVVTPGKQRYSGANPWIFLPRYGGKFAAMGRNHVV
jgi:hypothetical protein